MANIAHLSLDNRTKKWTAIYAGRVLAASPNKEYVINMIRGGRCNKANAANVTDVKEVGVVHTNTTTGKQEAVDRFGINERFDFLSDFVNMVADGTSPSLLVTGEGGLGKTFTVMKALREAGMTDLSEFMEFADIGAEISVAKQKKMFSVVKGYSTAKGLYRTLYENRHRVVIFDDCDSILRDPVALNLLKGALDSYDKRIISWNSEGFGGDDDLPRSFQFEGGVIFISNLQIFKIDQAVRSRAICVDLSMNTQQKIERMTAIISAKDFLPEYELTVKKNALSFLDAMKDQAKELSLRTLISVTKVAARGGDWKRRAEYLLTAV